MDDLTEYYELWVSVGRFKAGRKSFMPTKMAPDRNCVQYRAFILPPLVLVP